MIRVRESEREREEIKGEKHEEATLLALKMGKECRQPLQGKETGFLLEPPEGAQLC